MSLDAAAPQPAKEAPLRKTCESCGEVFSCMAAHGPCWCEEVKLDARTLAALRVRFGGCLCPRCLAAAKPAS